MSNQEEKKWIACCFCDYKCETEIEMSKHRCKPSPSPSCSHDKGDHWRGITSLATKKEYPDCCPYCKPTAVEPSVDEIAEEIVSKYFGKGIKTDLEVSIAEALRNERNRHG